jgi:hypothetical protein
LLYKLEVISIDIIDTFQNPWVLFDYQLRTSGTPPFIVASTIARSHLADLFRVVLLNDCHGVPLLVLLEQTIDILDESKFYF